MNAIYDPTSTAVLLVDPYNDFLSEGGKLWPLLKETAVTQGLLEHLRQIVASARATGVRIFIVPHHRAEPNDYASWKFPTASQLSSEKLQLFAKGSWGGEWHPDFAPQDADIVIKEHWGQNGFANTDLDQQLKQHGIQRVIVIGLVANTCLEATGRFAMEMGYHVTMVTDATAAFTPEGLQAAEVNRPSYAHAIVKTAEIVHSLEKK